jgi:hypothetical protein
MEIVQAMVRKNGLRHTITDWSPITRASQHLSGADIEDVWPKDSRLPVMSLRSSSMRRVSSLLERC